MIDKIKNVFDNIKQVYAVDVEIGANDAYRCQVVKLIKQDGEIDFSFPEITGDSLDAVCENIPRQSPICLLLNGKGIIYRKLTVKESMSEVDLVKTIIPNAKPEDFYLQQYTVSQQNDKSTKILSLARKSLIDKIISDFSGKFDFIVDISFSPFALDNILPVVSTKKIHYKNLLLEVEQQKIENFSLLNNAGEAQSISIGNNTIDSGLLPAFALGFSFLLDYKNLDTTVPNINERRGEYVYKQKIMLTSKIALIVLFVILLANFLIFDHFYKKVQSEEQSVANQEETIDKLNELKEEFASKDRFLQQSGLLEQNKVSFYLDRLAASVPNNITLIDLQVNPLANPNKKEDFDLINNLIRISGTSNRSASFNDWVKGLKADSVFTDVSIAAYEHDLKTNTAVFTIELLY